MQGQHCEEATTRDQRIQLQKKGRQAERAGTIWHAEAGRGCCSAGSQSTQKGAKKWDGPLLTDFKFQTGSKYVGFFSRTKIKSAQGAEVSQETTSSDSKL